ncbi:hypothetical protein NPIL_1761 [Nephila pilipes]|uniref:Uncharacterized protein n=1 Tax=Nephila pilipes TaxID=299642 RepID=A0A8X6QSA7_NEPPI|nr:hypothetical protein NPIL_1761 [Nephila pilipes]
MNAIGQGHASLTMLCGASLTFLHQYLKNFIISLLKCTIEVVEASVHNASLEKVTIINSSDIIIIRGNGTLKLRAYFSRFVVCAGTGDGNGKRIEAEMLSYYKDVILETMTRTTYL